MRISDWSSDVCSSDLAYRLADEEGHERDVEPTQPQRDDAEQESQERAQDSAEKEPQPGADPVVKLAQRGGVGPDGDEAGVAEVHQSGVADHPIGIAPCRERVGQYG